MPSQIRKYHSLLFWVTLFMSAGCGQDKLSLRTPGDTLRFMAIGDWGRDGQSHQADLAAAMESLAGKRQPHFVLALGDNFYPDGVDNISDPQWQTSFEQIYTGPHLQVPWYVALGNHDYYGSPTGEIDYSKHSNRWRLPSAYYTQLFNLYGGTKVRLVVLDTSPFDKPLYSDPSFGPKIKNDTTIQKHWMDSVFSIGDADWIIASGHHPVFTGGARKDDYNYVAHSLLSHLDPYVPVYFAGHEHDLQHLQDPQHFTQQFVSGAGSELRGTNYIPITKFAASIQGIMSVEVTRETLTVYTISYQLDTLYKVTLTKKKP